MPAAAVAAPQRAPRRARYLIPLGTPRRRELLAALAVLGVLGGLLFAPVTLGLAVAFQVIGKITRWRPVWLAWPAACGMVWVLAIGPAAAMAGFLAAPRAVVTLLGSVAATPTPLRHVSAASTGSVRWFPGQIPVALILAAGEPVATVTVSFEDPVAHRPVAITTAMLRPDLFRIVIQAGAGPDGRAGGFASVWTHAAAGWEP